jgi:3-oxoacyl-[acyl-carrier protein] reductase
VLGVIATGTFIGTREFGRHFMEHGLEGGAIVNISTLNHTAPASMLAAYCSAKAAVSQFTNVAALEYASMGVRVNAIAPGLVNTELAAAFLGESPEVPAAFVRNTPLARVGEPEDQARVAVFLASTASAWMTGVTLLVDGGLHLLGVPDNWELFKGPLGRTEPTPADWIADAPHVSGG